MSIILPLVSTPAPCLIHLLVSASHLGRRSRRPAARTAALPESGPRNTKGHGSRDPWPLGSHPPRACPRPWHPFVSLRRGCSGQGPAPAESAPAAIPATTRESRREVYGLV